MNAITMTRAAVLTSAARTGKCPQPESSRGDGAAGIRPQFRARLDRWRRLERAHAAYEQSHLEPAQAKLKAAIDLIPHTTAEVRNRLIAEASASCEIRRIIARSNRFNNIVQQAKWSFILMPVASAAELEMKIAFMIEEDAFSCDAAPGVLLADVTALAGRTAQ